MSEYEFLYEKIKRNKDLEIEDVNREDIKDIKDIKINKELSANDRIIDFLRKIENPYIFKVDNTLVKINYGTGNVDFMQCLSNIAKNNI